MSGTSIVGRVGESNVARVTSRGAVVTEGAGTAGTPAGGVVSVQGAGVNGLVVAGALQSASADGGADSQSALLITSGGGGFGSLLTRLVAYNGATWDRQRTPAVFKPFSAVLITAETTIWTPAAGKKFRIMGYVITQGVVTGAITLKDGTAGTTILVIPPNTIGVHQLSPAMGNGILSAAANNVLTATGVSTETITGYIFGTEE